MQTPELLLAFEEADRAWATTLATSIQAEVTAWSQSVRFGAEDVPTVRLATYDDLAGAETVDPTSTVLAVLPAAGSSFSDAVSQKLGGYAGPHAESEGDRVLPICREAGRERSPLPLTPLVAYHLHPGEEDVRRLVFRALTMMSLMTTGGMGVFISYRQRDGLSIAKAIEDELRKRGYEVWRDEHPDRDGIAEITPGSDAQKTIHRAILDRGFVLLIDTPDAQQSEWVQEEVNVAWGRMLPMLPIVVGAEPDRPTSRFLQLQGGRQVSLAKAALAPAQCSAIINAAMDEIEKAITGTATIYARTRRRVIADGRRALERKLYQWYALPDKPLMFAAERALADPLTPDLKLRLLVHCSPVRRISQRQLRLLEKTLDERADTDPKRFQYGILVHNSDLSATALHELLGGTSHLMILEPAQIEAIFATHRL